MNIDLQETYDNFNIIANKLIKIKTDCELQIEAISKFSNQQNLINTLKNIIKETKIHHDKYYDVSFNQILDNNLQNYCLYSTQRLIDSFILDATKTISKSSKIIANIYAKIAYSNSLNNNINESLKNINTAFLFDETNKLAIYTLALIELNKNEFTKALNYFKQTVNSFLSNQYLKIISKKLANNN